MGNIGYCCISIGINNGKKKKDFITVNRGMVKKTFLTKGLDYVLELSIENLKDLLKILKYNLENNILVYRLSSDIFPWMSEYKFKDLPNFNYINSLLIKIGDYIKENNMRCGFHPSHFNVLASDNPNVVIKTIDELNKHSEILDLMGLEQSHYYSINIHVNTTKPTRELAAERFCTQFHNLSESCKKRLVVENDDGLNQYSTKMLYDLIHTKIGIPITHDFHHHNYGPQDISQEEALKLAFSTWDVKPLTHMSSPKTIEDSSGKNTAHADYIYEKIETYGLDVDVEIEAKAKDLAVIKYINEYKIK